MEELGESVGRELKGKEIIYLSGDLGSGKTTFVRGIARGMGIEEGYQVRSPTFTLVNEYPTKKGRLIHVDLYRVRDFDFSEFIGEGVVVVEWKEMDDLCDLWIDIKVVSDTVRKVRIFRRELSNP
ncbi:MAG TPA: tRNA (adenosine(37)-N6)-threonylcarbamoyltransferase complex ATPase subunit type 1 TsaE [Aquifex aeolicus]|nr:tRNA (adenosine(37)-N6)-threonylcarbamoyltransferase complex ATPase subunit type 1 TsaE [Aquifex aeolicus]